MAFSYGNGIDTGFGGFSGGGFDGGFGSGFSGGLGFNSPSFGIDFGSSMGFGNDMFGLQTQNMQPMPTEVNANLDTNPIAEAANFSNTTSPIGNTAVNMTKAATISPVSSKIPGTGAVYGKLGNTGKMGWGSPESLVPGSATGAISLDANNNPSLVGNYGQNSLTGTSQFTTPSTGTVNSQTGSYSPTSQQGGMQQQGGGLLGGMSMGDILGAVGGLAQAWMQYKAMQETMKQNAHKLRAADIANQNARERSKSVNEQLSGNRNYKTRGKDFPEYKG